MHDNSILYKQYYQVKTGQKIYNMAQSLRDNHDLQQFILTDVTTTGRTLGTGSYGSVEEVRIY